ncbi:MAG: hypothetical protein HN793_10630 [Rhodospirillaceae bacterium]|nr:hypothetical protein [Rhodospirillaceae bacterium]
MSSALIIFGLIALAFLTHLGFFAIGVGPTDLEAFYVEASAGSSVYGSVQTLLQSLFGDSIVVGRAFSVICAMTGLVLLARLCASWTGDVIVGAVMPLGLLMFPQAAFVFALATPHALMMLLTIVGLMAATRVSEGRPFVAPMQVGGVCGVLIFLDPAGLGIAAGIVAFVILERRDRTFLTTLVAMVIIVGLVLSLLFPIPLSAELPSGLVETRALTLQDGLWRGFAMLWVALAFSAVALWRSAALRLSLGDHAVRRSVALGLSFVIATLWLIYGIAPPPADVPVWFTAILVLGVVSALPLVLWIRFVMPSIQSVWIWILLPVVMYSCFWVVLGPINLGAFPYDQIESRP